MPDPRALTSAAARALLGQIGDPDPVPALRVVERVGRAACLILVWEAGRPMPSARATGRREGCKAAIRAALDRAGGPLTTKELTKALRGVHGPGAVGKALAEMTAGGELLNTRDKRGYRLPGWHRHDQPTLF